MLEPRDGIHISIDNDFTSNAKADVPKTRRCLRCTTEFESSGFGDRICRRCKGTSEWRNGIATTYGASRRR